MTARIRHLELTFNPKGSPEFIINRKEFAVLQHQTFIKFQVQKQVSSEPNKASLEIYNLSEEHTGAIDFKFDPRANNFGPQVTIKGGYVGEDIRQMYTGVVISALTTFEAPNFITRIELGNNLFELMRRPVKYQVSGSKTSKYDVIIDIIKQAGGDLEAGQDAYLKSIVGTSIYDEDELVEGTLDEVTALIVNGQKKRLVIYWDDAGVNFTPSGKKSVGRETKIISEETGLIGSPKATSNGIEYETRLDSTYRVSDPVKLISRTTDKLFKSSILGGIKGGTINMARSDEMVVTKIIHSGDNREGDFKTSVSAKFLDLIDQRTLGLI